jgi:hypothetical protein
LPAKPRERFLRRRGLGLSRAGRGSNAASGPKLLCEVSLAAGVAALAGNLDGILVRFAMGTAVFLVGHAGTGGVGAFLLVSHVFVSPLRMLNGQSFRLDASSRVGYRSVERELSERQRGLVTYGWGSCFQNLRVEVVWKFRSEIIDCLLPDASTVIGPQFVPGSSHCRRCLFNRMLLVVSVAEPNDE